MSVVVVDYGAGNTRSVRAAFARLGAESVVTNDADALADASLVVLPGVGSAKSAMTNLQSSGAAAALRRRHDEGGAILGICLGLQLAAGASDEDGGVVGLGLLGGRVVRLRGERVPHLGWANVEPWGEVFYFAHSYELESADAVAFADGVTAAARRGSFLGVQFHPEKSGAAGLEFLSRCLSRV